MSKIGVVIKEPGRKPRHVNISDSEKNLKTTVGGEFVLIPLFTDAGIIVNRNRSELPFCCDVLGTTFNGTVIFCGTDVTRTKPADLPISFEDFKTAFRNLFYEKE